MTSAPLTSLLVIIMCPELTLIFHLESWKPIFLSSIQIFDKLCQSFGGDVLQALFNSSEGLASCSSENMIFWILRFISDQALAMAFSNILVLGLSIYSFFWFNNGLNIFSRKRKVNWYAELSLWLLDYSYFFILSFY